ncbi:MAG TPA: hypothetical protein VIQ53_03795, partial [Inquilinus sp.]
FDERPETDDLWYHEDEPLYRISRHLGAADQLADPDWVAELGAKWSVNHRGRGRTWTGVRWKWNREKFFGKGPPNFSQALWGHDGIHDPRTGRVGWTNNWALVVAHHLKAPWGYRATDAEILQDELIASANISDEYVPILESSAPFEWDDNSEDLLIDDDDLIPLGHSDRVRLTTTGTLPAPLAPDTDYYLVPLDRGRFRLAASLLDSRDLVEILCTDHGEGIHTITRLAELRYTADGNFRRDQERDEVLGQIATAAAGIVAQVGGRWLIQAAAARPATMSLTEDDLRGGEDLAGGEASESRLEVRLNRSEKDMCNQIKPRFIWPEAVWQPTDAPMVSDADAIAEDGGEEKARDAEYLWTVSHTRTQRLAKIALRQTRRQITITWPGKWTCYGALPGTVVRVSLRDYDWVEKLFRVKRRDIVDDGIDLELEEEDPSIYAWDPATDERPLAIPPKPVTGEEELPDEPASIGIDTPLTALYTSLAIVWEDGELRSDTFQVAYRVPPSTEWIVAGSVDTERRLVVPTSAPIVPRVRAGITLIGTSYTDWTEGTMPGDPSGILVVPGPGTITITWSAGDDATATQVFGAGSNSPGASTLLGAPAGGPFSEAGLTAGTTRHYWLRSVGATGIPGPLVYAGSATAT